MRRPPPPFEMTHLESALRGTAVPGISAVFLFGSAASGRLHADSDVDVAVLLDRRVHPTERDRFEARVALSADLAAGLGDRLVDVVVLNDVSPLFARRIVLEGRRLSCADPAAEHAFRRDVQLQAGDLEPLVRRIRRIALEALAR